MIVQRLQTTGQSYDCYVNRSHIIDALQYKVKYEPYYMDVTIHTEHLAGIPKIRTYISDMLKTIETIEDILMPNIQIEIDKEINGDNKS